MDGGSENVPPSSGGPSPPEPPPQIFPNTPPPQSANDSQSQQVYVLIGSVSALEVKLARVISDAAEHASKIDTMRNQISFVRGALWIISGIIATALIVAGIYFKS